MSPSQPAPACRCCGSSAVRSRGRKRGAFIPRDFEYLACDACGYLYVEPFAGYEIYNDDYYRGLGPDPYVDYGREYADHRATDRVLEFDDLARLVRGHFASVGRPPGRTLDWLDFGCGAGGLLKYLSAPSAPGRRPATDPWPVRVAGHDVGSYADLLRTRDGFRILDFTALHALPDAQFDVISMVEVIEHIEFPAPVIALVSRLLRPGGILLLTTGNNDCFVARRAGLAYRYYLPEIHVGVFNPACLSTLYTRQDLTPHFVRYSGVVRFKILKSLLHPGRRRLARWLLALPLVVRLIDRAYGVSAMPCAIKPGL